MDEADIAAVNSDRELESILAAARTANLVTTPGTVLCVDCEDEIPEARRKAVPNAVRCAFCQSEVG